MNLFLYLDNDTWLHRLDPRTKLTALVMLFGICLIFNHPLPLGILGAAVAAAAASAGALGNFRRLRWLFLLLFLFSTALWPFFAEGPTTLWSWHGLVISRESLLYGTAMGIRLVIFVGTGLLLLSTTRHEEIVSGLILLRLPYPVAFALATALRLVPTFAGAGATIIQAQMSRGLDLETGNVFRRFARSVPQAIPLFIYAIRHTNHLAMALEARGFSPSASRTLYREPHMRGIDWLALGALVLLFCLLLSLRLILHIGVAIPGRL